MMRLSWLFLFSLVGACGGDSSDTADSGLSDGSAELESGLSDGSAELESGLSDGAMDGAALDGGLEDASLAAPGRPVLSVTRAATEEPFQGLVALTQPGEAVEAVIITVGETPRLWRVEVGMSSPQAVHDVVEPPGISDDYGPSAVRAGDGSLHVVWQSDSGRNVRYATDATGAWTETTIDRGETPSVALAADGTPIVVFVDGADAVVARPNGATWSIDPVRGVGDTRAWTAISGTIDLVVAGTVGDGTLWVKRDEGGSWVDQPIDVSPFLATSASADHALAAGPAGILLSFQNNLRYYAAYRPAGATEFSVRDLGANFELKLEATRASIGDVDAFIGGVDINGERLALLAPGEPSWPLVAAVPWATNDCSERRFALSLDGADQPIMAALDCGGNLFIFQTVGTYPADYDERCTAAVTTLCDQACACGSAEDACAFVSERGDSAGNRAGCELAARETLCSNSTKPFDALVSCIASLDEPGTCEALGYRLPATCSALRNLE